MRHALSLHNGSEINRLFRLNCTRRANALASATINAGASIYDSNAGIADLDSANRACTFASAATDARISNLMCHTSKLLFSVRGM
jgi:hypothetical protein